MHYEAKHQHFKQLSRVIGNYINICHTLAERHQLCQCYWLSSDETFERKLEVGPGKYLMSIYPSVPNKNVYTGETLTNIPSDIQNISPNSSTFFRYV